MRKKTKRKSLPTSSRKSKLSAEHKAVVINLLGAFETPTNIAAYLLEKYNIKVSAQNIGAYAERYPDEIKLAREKILNELDLLPTTNKICRIKLRQDLVFDIMGHPNKNYADDKLWLEEANTAGVMVRKRGNHSIVNDLLDSIQAELEPRKMALTDPTGKQDLIREREEILAKAMAKVTELNENSKHTSG
jgi:hypothetical protein